MKNLKKRLAAAMVVGLAGAAQAALVDRGGGMIYDTVLNLTWLADMNYAWTQFQETSGVQGHMYGLMNFAQSKRWANDLTYGGFDDWRLPTLNSGDTTCSGNFNPGGGLPLQYVGFNCSGGELSHLFAIDLGIKPNEPVMNGTGDTAEQIANLALFSNVRGVIFWSGTEYAPDSSRGFVFSAGSGLQLITDKGATLYAMAVRSGDVGAAVPEPHTLALTVLALTAAVVVRRKREV